MFLSYSSRRGKTEPNLDVFEYVDGHPGCTIARRGCLLKSRVSCCASVAFGLLALDVFLSLVLIKKVGRQWETMEPGFRHL